MYLSFYNSAGRITEVDDFPDDITAPEIAALTPVGGGYYVGRTEPATQWFDTGVLDDRPVLTTEDEFTIAADGVDDVTIPVPSGTTIVCNTVDGAETVTSGADFVYTSDKKAADHFVLTPPFPYVPAEFWIFSGQVASKTYESVKTDDLASGAVEPLKLSAEVISVNEAFADGPFTLDDAARNILVETTVTFEPVDAPFVYRRFSICVMCGSTSTLLTGIGKVFVNVDDGTGWLLSPGYTPFGHAAFRALQANLTCCYQTVLIVNTTGSQTEMTFGLDCFIDSGESGSLKNASILVVHHATAEA